MYAVYVVECADGTFYTGITTDVARRLREHNREVAGAKGARYTAARGPVRLVYAQPCADRSEALREEHRIKRLTRSQKQELIASGMVTSVAGRRQPPDDHGEPLAPAPRVPALSP